MDDVLEPIWELLGLFIVALILGLIGTAIGQTRGRPEAGFLWGFLLGPIGWLIIVLGPNPKKQKEEDEMRNRVQTTLIMQAQQLAELRALRESLSTRRAPTTEIKEDKYWVRLKERELGPIDRLELIELFSSGKIGLETQVAPDTETGSRIYSALANEIPSLKSIGRGK